MPKEASKSLEEMKSKRIAKQADLDAAVAIRNLCQPVSFLRPK
jgi:hypothetical protein